MYSQGFERVMDLELAFDSIFEMLMSRKAKQDKALKNVPF
jgi:hypothetical protein